MLRVFKLSVVMAATEYVFLLTRAQVLDIDLNLKKTVHNIHTYITYDSDSIDVYKSI